MGSSAMGATKFHNRIKAERPDLTVTNSSVDTIPADADVVVCQRVLADRAAKCAPQAQLVTLDNFLADPHLDALYNALTSTTPALDAKAEAAANEEIVSDLRNAAVAPLAAAVTEASKANGSVMKIQAEDIQLGLPSVTKEEAIRAAGALLAKRGYVDDSYADAMVEREKLVSTYMGMGVAIPHAPARRRAPLKSPALSCCNIRRAWTSAMKKPTSCSALPVSATTISTCWAMSARFWKTRMRWNSSRPLPI